MLKVKQLVLILGVAVVLIAIAIPNINAMSVEQEASNLLCGEWGHLGSEPFLKVTETHIGALKYEIKEVEKFASMYMVTVKITDQNGNQYIADIDIEPQNRHYEGRTTMSLWNKTHDKDMNLNGKPFVKS